MAWSGLEAQCLRATPAAFALRRQLKDYHLQQEAGQRTHLDPTMAGVLPTKPLQLQPRPEIEHDRPCEVSPMKWPEYHRILDEQLPWHLH